MAFDKARRAGIYSLPSFDGPTAGGLGTAVIGMRMTGMRFELLWGYCHCFGKTTYHGGFAASEADARRWVQNQPRRIAVPEIPAAEPLRRCPVTACPGKHQRPWFGFRQAAPGETGRA